MHAPMHFGDTANLHPVLPSIVTGFGANVLDLWGLGGTAHKRQRERRGATSGSQSTKGISFSARNCSADAMNAFSQHEDSSYRILIRPIAKPIAHVIMKAASWLQEVFVNTWIEKNSNTYWQSSCSAQRLRLRIR